MTKSVAKALLIFCAFFVEIRVRAARIEEPKGCLRANKECAVFNSSGTTTFKMQNAEVRMAPGASIVKKAPDLLRVVRGNVLIKTHDTNLRVESLFGDAKVSGGDVIVEATDDMVKIVNLSGEVRYRPRGTEADLDLPKGLMNELARVATNGQAVSAYPRSMSLKPLVETWSSFFTKKEFKILKADFEQFLPHWRAGLDFVGPWYLETVTREIAAHKAELERLRRLKEARDREENYYREMFKRKNFLD